MNGAVAILLVAAALLWTVVRHQIEQADQRRDQLDEHDREPAREPDWDFPSRQPRRSIGGRR